MTFGPPLVDPALPPTHMSTNSTAWLNGGQRSYEAVVYPVVVITETAWNTAGRKHARSPAPVSRCRTRVTRSEAPKSSPVYVQNSRSATTAHQSPTRNSRYCIAKLVSPNNTNSTSNHSANGCEKDA